MPNKSTKKATSALAACRVIFNRSKDPQRAKLLPKFAAAIAATRPRGKKPTDAMVARYFQIVKSEAEAT